MAPSNFLNGKQLFPDSEDETSPPASPDGGDSNDSICNNSGYDDGPPPPKQAEPVEHETIQDLRFMFKDAFVDKEVRKSIPAHQWKSDIPEWIFSLQQALAAHNEQKAISAVVAGLSAHKELEAETESAKESDDYWRGVAHKARVDFRKLEKEFRGKLKALKTALEVYEPKKKVDRSRKATRGNNANAEAVAQAKDKASAVDLGSGDLFVDEEPVRKKAKTVTKKPAKGVKGRKKAEATPANINIRVDANHSNDAEWEVAGAATNRDADVAMADADTNITDANNNNNNNNNNVDDTPVTSTTTLATANGTTNVDENAITTNPIGKISRRKAGAHANAKQSAAHKQLQEKGQKDDE